MAVGHFVQVRIPVEIGPPQFWSSKPEGQLPVRYVNGRFGDIDGNVMLEGVVANEGDKNIAALQANSVPGVFSVTNNLRVERQG